MSKTQVFSAVRIVGTLLFPTTNRETEAKDGREETLKVTNLSVFSWTQAASVAARELS